MWTPVTDALPEAMEEVLVWVDGHRGPSWRNNHALVAYLGEDGQWYEERHLDCGAIAGVLMWMPIYPP